MPKGEDPLFEEERASGVQDDLRQQIAHLMLERLSIITTDTMAIFAYSGAERLDADYCRRVGNQLVQLLAFAVRDGRIDPRGSFIAGLHSVVLARTLPIERLFTFAYLAERTTLDELALDDQIGATSEPWPLVAQLVRRGSFDLLGAYMERAQLEPSGAAITDKLTTLHTRPVFEAALGKELERAARFGDPLALILFDVDHLSAINKEHGYGVGDKILERLGILMRTYFRQHDWVARLSEDTIAVLLSRTDADHANELAERVRSTVVERLGFMDLTDRHVTISVSAAIINMTIALGDVVDTERLMTDAEAALERAKRKGRNRVERVDGYSGRHSSRPIT
jgi:diguanylate cyclase (GGDEF)-like protein